MNDYGVVAVSKDNSGGITIAFQYDPQLVQKVKTIEGRKWHKDKKCWSFPSSDDTLGKILKAFEGEKIHIDPTLQIELPRPVIAKRPERSEGTPKQSHFEDLRRELISRKYSYKTVKCYLYYNRDFLIFVDKKPSEINDSDIKDYLLYLAEEKQSATSTLNQAINALKFYYGTMLKKRFVYEVKRPRKDKKLPTVLSKEEVAEIISVPQNIKHRALIMLVYLAGLRVGEVVKLRPEDIDEERMLVHIKGAKGRKDRYTLLSESTLKTLREYLELQRPVKWLFPGPDKERHLTVRTAQRIFEMARERAEIKKDVTIHSLRHSFATHLLENGIDLRYIQEILGHKSSKTTEIYTHVSNKNLMKIRNPLDQILEGKDDGSL